MADERTGCVVRGSASYESEQGPTYAPGVSAETVDAKALFLGVVTMDPGVRNSRRTFTTFMSPPSTW